MEWYERRVLSVFQEIMTVTVQEGINEVDTGIKFDLQFNYDDDDSDYKDSTECRLTITQLFRWLRMRVVEPLWRLWRRSYGETR